MTAPLLVRATRREPVERTPCGSCARPAASLPEYRAIRERHAFFEVAHTPELCAEVTLQPVRRHGVDAAVMFADIMTPVLGMGVDVELVEGVGPVVEQPVRARWPTSRGCACPSRRRRSRPCSRRCGSCGGELAAEKAVVGFCGGPFTVAGYLVEGRPSRELPRTKALMLSEPATWDALMAKLSETFAGYVAAKVAAGADVIQLFDSWVGDALAHALPRSRRAVERGDPRRRRRADDPLRHGRVPPARRARRRGRRRDRPRLAHCRSTTAGRSSPTAPSRGTSIRRVLAAPWEVVEREALDVLERAAGRPGHVFNLGHGVLPGTDPDTLTRLAALVRERSATQVAA